LDFPGANRTIAYPRARQQPVTESDRVDERLECGTNLPVRRSKRAIEFALRIITSTYQRTNSTAGIINYNHGAFQIRHGRIPFSVLRRMIGRFDRMMKIGLMLDFRERRLQG